MHRARDRPPNVKPKSAAGDATLTSLWRGDVGIRRAADSHGVGPHAQRRRTARAVAHRAATRRTWDTHRTSYSYSYSSRGAQAQRHRESTPRDECSHRQAYMQTQRADRAGGWGDTKGKRQRTLLRHANCFCKLVAILCSNAVCVWHSVSLCSFCKAFCIFLEWQ